MKIEDLVGRFQILGSNQDGTEKSYQGTLELALDENNKIDARWLINRSQQQFGTGFFKDNILVINFQYQGDENTIYKGVAVYRCISKDILDGFWSEEYGNPLFLGEERCFRLKEEGLLN